MATEVNEPGCSSSQCPSDNTLTRVTTGEAEDSGEDASKSSSRTSAGSAEPEPIISTCVFYCFTSIFFVFYCFTSICLCFYILF